VFYLLFSRHNRKLEYSGLVEGSNVVIRAGGDKEADSLWILRIKIVRVYRSGTAQNNVKVKKRPVSYAE
jgi:hypothetical protein